MCPHYQLAYRSKWAVSLSYSGYLGNFFREDLIAESWSHDLHSFRSASLSRGALVQTKLTFQLSWQLDSNQRFSGLRSSPFDHSGISAFSTTPEIRTLTVRFWRPTGTTYAEKYLRKTRDSNPEHLSMHLFSRQTPHAAGCLPFSIIVVQDRFELPRLSEQIYSLSVSTTHPLNNICGANR